MRALSLVDWFYDVIRSRGRVLSVSLLSFYDAARHGCSKEKVNNRNPIKFERKRQDMYWPRYA